MEKDLIARLKEVITLVMSKSVSRYEVRLSDKLYDMFLKKGMKEVSLYNERVMGYFEGHGEFELYREPIYEEDILSIVDKSKEPKQMKFFYIAI